MVGVSINKLLAGIFYKIGFIESWGRGTLKIICECKKASIPEPNFYEEHGVVKIIFELTGGLIPPLYGGLNGGQQKVFQVIQGKEGVKGKEIAEFLGIPIDTIDKHIKVLINKNFIERRGSKKTGGYFIVNLPKVQL